MGVAVLVCARPQARQSMGIRPLSHARGRHADPGARYVRALLSHRLRRQGSELRRYLYERHSLACGGPAFWETCRRHGAEILTGRKAQRRRTNMRAVKLLVAICATATIGTAANAQGID